VCSSCSYKKILKIFFLTFALSGCWLTSEEEDTLVVLTSADYPPFEFYEKKGIQFELAGFDIDLIKRIAQHLNKKIEIQDMSFETIIPYVSKTHKNVIAISSISITSDRQKLIDYSIPYYFSNVGVLRHKHTQLDLQDSFKGTLGVQVGSTLENIAKTYQVLHKDLKLKAYYKMDDIINDLLTYKIDGTLIEETPGIVYEEAYKWSLFFKRLKETHLAYAIILPKNSKLKSRIDDIIKQLQQIGVLNALAYKWFVSPKKHDSELVVAEIL